VKCTIERLGDGDVLIEVVGQDVPLTGSFTLPDGRQGGRWWGTGQSGPPKLIMRPSEPALLDGRMDLLRKAIQEFRATELESNEIEVNGQVSEGPDEEAAARASREFLLLIAYVVLAVELETSEG
jgi:hypothetical protein